MTTTFSRKKTLVYSLLPAIVLFTSLEIGARIAELKVPPLKAEYSLGFVPDSPVFVPQYGTDLFHTNPTRGSFIEDFFKKQKPANGFRIFVVGESSVWQLRQEIKDFEKHLNQQFKGKYFFECVDAGACAYGSHRLAPLVCELMDYAPDLILVYMGHNEFCEADHARFVNLKTLWLQRIVYRSALCRFIRDRVALQQISAYQRAQNKEILDSPNPNWARSLNKDYTPAELNERMAYFRSNYRVIIETCRAKHVPIIIGTMATNLWSPKDANGQHGGQMAELAKLRDSGKFEETKEYARRLLAGMKRLQACDIENGIIRELATEYQLPLADVETAVTEAEPHHVPGEMLFDDHCHLNANGRKILMAKFEELVMKHLQKMGITP